MLPRDRHTGRLDLDPAAGGRGRPRRLEPQGGRRVSRPAAGLVAEMAAGGPRSRHVLRVVPHGGDLRAGAAGAARRARRSRPFRQRAGAAGERHQAGDDVEGRRAVLPRSDPRPAEDERVARHRGDPQRADPLGPRRARRIARRRHAPRVRQPLGAAVHQRRAVRRVGVAELPLRAVGSRRIRVLRCGARGDRGRHGARRLCGER